ncbi:MAG: OmpA family protein [Bacteroidetes bacterium]|nr:OmpA family protein [Bacteroidota bacterium]MCL6101781.1 OmpA family protein [Bacteroidota bacterium]
MKTRLIVVLLPLALLGACVSSKKFTAQQNQFSQEKSAHAKTRQDLSDCENQRKIGENKIADLQSQLTALKDQNSFLKENNTQALKQLENLSVISSSQAESIKKSMENMGVKDNMIYSLQSSLAQRDSLNMALVMNLKGAIGNLDDKDINIKVDKGVVYIDISDKMLFKSGSYNITDRASEVLGKVATVLKNQKDIEFMVEGHTDNVPFSRGDLLDNWDLSVKRATAVVRVLQNKYGLNPSMMTAAGRSEYQPIGPNDTVEGRAANRRTRIVILPQLDQFFKLLERPGR